MTRDLRFTGRGRRNLLRRPYAPYQDVALPQRSEESFKMVSRSIYVDQDVSLQGMVPLNASDNILISSSESLWKCHDMLLARLAKIDKHQYVRLHLRLNLFNTVFDRYRTYLENGTEMVLWHSDAALAGADYENLTTVRMRGDIASAQEGFLVITTPFASRLLAAWRDPIGKLVGVLVTNPRSVERVSAKLDAIIQTASR